MIQTKKESEVEPIIRPATLFDFPDLIDLFEESIMWIPDHVYSVSEKETWVRKGNDPESWKESIEQDIFLIAMNEDQMVGFISLTQKGYLDKLFVHPSFWGKRVASALLAKLDEHITEWELDHIRTDASLVARPFFERKGFTEQYREVVKIERESLTRFRMVKFF